MPILHLGVIDLPYQKRRGPRTRRSLATVTTGDVAVTLENRYHVMEIFARENEEFIADQLTESLKDAAESLMQGNPVTADPFGAGTSQIEHRFKQFLSLQEMDKLGVPGVPTQAAQEGRSSRFKKRKGRGPRPSFIDTGLYQSSFKAWMEDEHPFSTALTVGK